MPTREQDEPALQPGPERVGDAPVIIAGKELPNRELARLSLLRTGVTVSRYRHNPDDSRASHDAPIGAGDGNRTRTVSLGS